MSEGEKKIVHVAVGVVWRNGRILIARRPDTAHQGGLLEFPGGKVEPGETVQQALARELMEETAVRVAPEHLKPLIGIRHDYGDKQVFLDVWQTRESSGEPRGVEGQPIFWSSPDELKPTDFPAANRPIINAIRLPCQLAITGDSASVGVAATTYARNVEASSPAMVVLRAPSRAPDEYASLAALCLQRKPDTPLIVHDRPELVEDLPVAGVHLSWRKAAELRERPVSEDRWFGVSCHDADELAHAAAIRADYATLGPVLATPSHAGVAGMGWQRFSELVADAVLPVYTLGGTGPELLATGIRAGAQGIAGISWWWHSQEPEAK